MTTSSDLPALDMAPIAELLRELSEVQAELLAVLREKQSRMVTRQPEELHPLQAREEQLIARLQACHARRQELLALAHEQGFESDSITSLVEQHAGPGGARLRSTLREAESRTRILQHQSLTNWVIAQRALLHVAQLLEIIATGGRMQPTYGNSASVVTRGNLLSSEA